jgi:adenosylcobyric acid synthase
VSLRYVGEPDEFGTPDLVVIPGTKTTIADLRWLRARGLAARIEAHTASGAPVIGICGGYQMLGATIEDPGGVESPGGEIVAGLGLLPVRTIFAPEKATHRVHARVLRAHGLLAGCGAHALSGYEIHMGRTTVVDTPVAGAALKAMAEPTVAPLPAFIVESRSGYPVEAAAPKTDGLLDPSGRILGTYLHGLFDNAGLRRALLQHLATAKGVSAAPESAAWGHLATLDEQFDRLAAAVRASLDIRRLSAIAGV